jgi:hypothetical protein
MYLNSKDFKEYDMQQLSLKISFMLTALLFLGFASRDLNIHHTTLSLENHAGSGKTVTLQLADLLYAEPTLKIKRAQ